MTTDRDAIYFYQRAEEELELAQKAENPAAVKAHYLLAGHYLDGVYGKDGAADVATKESEPT